MYKKTAILEGNTEALKATEENLPNITCFAIVPAEDDEPAKDNDEDTQKSSENVLNAISA